MSDDPNKRPNGPNSPWAESMLIPWAFALLLLVMFSMLQPGAAVETVSYSEMKRLIGTGAVAEAVLGENAITVTLAADTTGEVARYKAVTPVQPDPDLLAMLEAADVEITAEAPAGDSLLLLFLPWIVILGVYVWLQRRMFSQIGGIDSRGIGGMFSGRFSQPTASHSDTTFADVAGQEQAKKEVAELVEFLREPERFQRVGAVVPRGVLLMGPPGTGKTLLARALAGEAGVPFFSTSGSEFIEVFVGVGAGRVRAMFDAARKSAPSVIFIDELDSIGRTRGTGLGGGHDEREQTLNQILAELDGFTGREAVVVLAATNRPDVLDPALLRPGRFDRHVTLNLPDQKARRAILDIHARDIPLSNTADLDDVAAGTPGFSGADLRNLLNEAAILAARRQGDLVDAADLQEARDKIILGTVRTLAIQPQERHRLAVHEAGHTAVAHFTPEADPLYKVTIIPRGRSLGGTHMLSREEHHTLPEGYLRAQLAILLAGRAAERHFLGSVSSGADDDIKRATELARSMVARWGMTEELGPVDLRQSEDHPFLGQSIAQPREHADETAARVDLAVMTLLKKAEAQAEDILSRNEDAVSFLIRELEKREVLEADEIRLCLDAGEKVRPMKPRLEPPSISETGKRPEDCEKGSRDDPSSGT
ncbi:ATP-dependent zinc metalloprotease FtsH [Tropicimonas sediminicola]|uniref:ATP-dependent zinc metalloprotease FtsH n=1 Tax=Tropicimonas sediminicola TaxID=1031541 RepID=A0A239L9W9_9RHOB|nr:ATP-dependent zinc metalloprotease FtsH [Tropicimonas sediminicola]SNT27085.1 cell division protease FtsH [Tropicimonas sediminicola]